MTFFFCLSFILMFAQASELKTVNHHHKSIDEVEVRESSLTPEQAEKLKKDVEKIRSNQEEAKKYLEELDKDE